MCLWRHRLFEITVAFLCMILYSNLPLSSALFGWVQGKKKVQISAAHLDRDAFNAEKTGEEFVNHSMVNRGPDGCGHKLKAALSVVKAYGASFKHWHWPWRKKKKTMQMNPKGKKQRNVDEQLRIIDHCAAIAEREEYQRGHFGQRRRQRRRARVGSPRDMDDKSALKALTRMLKRRNKVLSIGDHWTNIGLIRWGRRTIRGIRRPAVYSAMKARRRNKKNGKGRKNGNKNGRRRMKREDDEEEEDEDETTDDEDGGQSDEDDDNGTKFKFTKKAHGYSSDKNAGSNAKDKIYEAISFEAEHPEKGRYTQRTMTEYKFHGPKHSEWRQRPPKPPKADEERAWTGKFKSRQRRGGNRHRDNHQQHTRSRDGRKSRRGRRKRKKNFGFAHYGSGDNYHTVAHLPAVYSYGHHYDYGSPWWYSYSENYYDGGFGHGGGFAAEEGDGGFMPSGSLGAAMKILGIVLFVILLIIII